MKLKLLLLILLAVPVIGDVTWEIMETALDPRTNVIIVKTHYKIDGVEVPSKYPKVNGKSVKWTRFSTLNFTNMTDAEILTKIQAETKTHAKNLIRRKYAKEMNADIQANRLTGLVNSNGTETQANILLDTDKDGVLDTELEVKTDGTKTTKPYTPPAP